MLAHHAAAEHIAREKGDPAVFQPSLERMAASVVLHDGRSTPPELQAERLAALKRGLSKKHLHAPDFGSIVGSIELRLYEAIASGQLDSAECDAIKRAYVDLHEGVVAPSMWDSVRDQLRFLRQATRFTRAERALLDELIASVAPWCSIAQSHGESVVSEPWAEPPTSLD
jgi:hypothetical protein